MGVGTTEEGMFKYLKKHVAGMWQRIERNPSVPDVYWCRTGVQCWFELKIDRGSILVRKGQWGWLTRHAMAGGCGYVLAYNPEYDWFTLYDFLRGVVGKEYNRRFVEIVSPIRGNAHCVSALIAAMLRDHILRKG